MAKLSIDNREVEVPEGATLLDAARTLGIEIPTLCHLDGRAPLTSCFVCVVKLKGANGFVPSCATLAADGMEVESETNEVRDARRSALELLLSDHLGDCVGPCHNLCPAEMDIPRMLRQIAAGRLRDAIATVKADIPLPAVLGRICPAPCEKGCRRGEHDAPVSICLLKRYVGDADLGSGSPWLPECRPSTGKRVAIVGAGPAGLSAAFYLLQAGHACTLFDDHDKAGGMLEHGVPEERLPREVVDAEAALITRLGAEFRGRTRLGEQVSLDELRRDFDAVLIAVGRLEEGEAKRLGLPDAKQGIQIDRATYETGVSAVFAAGGAVRPSKMAVRAVAGGKGAATSIDQFLGGGPVVGPGKLYTTRVGRLAEGEMPLVLADASGAARVEPRGGLVAGFTDEEARAEAGRCLHCDCRKPVSCKLRHHAARYGASPTRHKGERRRYERHDHHEIIYEPGKCITCGVCVSIASEAREELGLTFIGRGFNVRIGVPFNRSIDEGLKQVARECALACPTGALALKEESA